MCLPSLDDETKCIHTGLPLINKGRLGVFCSANCGLIEALIFDKIKNTNLHQQQPPASPTVINNNQPVTAADRFIDSIHIWIEQVISQRNFSDFDE